MDFLIFSTKVCEKDRYHSTSEHFGIASLLSHMQKYMFSREAAHFILTPSESVPAPSRRWTSIII